MVKPKLSIEEKRIIIAGKEAIRKHHIKKSELVDFRVSKMVLINKDFDVYLFKFILKQNRIIEDEVCMAKEPA